MMIYQIVAYGEHDRLEWRAIALRGDGTKFWVSTTLVRHASVVFDGLPIFTSSIKVTYRDELGELHECTPEIQH